MDCKRLEELLGTMRSVNVAIVGDFFLDLYLIIDPALEETSLETGLPAHQVVRRRPSPGAAGSVSTKVAALGVGIVHAVTMLGDDGNGYELSRELKNIGLCFDYAEKRTDRFTPTYGKPMIHRPNGIEEEINRIDIKNHEPIPAEVEDAIIGSLHKLANEVQGIIVVDQVEQRNCGVITDRVRETLAQIGSEHPELFILADSRNRIGEFQNLMIKPNASEAAKALGVSLDESKESVMAMAQKLAARSDRPVFVTMGEKGLVAADKEKALVVPVYPVEGMIDTTGAGDTVTAGVVSALCAGATLYEAAEIGNLAASITIKQLGTTGTATPKQMMKALQAANEQ